MLEVTLTDNREEVLAAAADAIERALEAVGLQAEGYVKLELERPKEHARGIIRPNVDTGRLVNSITHQVKTAEQAVYIGTNVEYAPYVEYGTRFARAYPYLQPGIENHVDEYKAIFQAFLQGGA